VTVSSKNVSDDTIQIMEYLPYAQYRMALFDERGVPVAKSKQVIEEENRPPSDPAEFEFSFLYSVNLAPGQVTAFRFDLSNWFTLEKGGVYQLVVMRQVGDSLGESNAWKKGCAISNLIKIEIVEP